MLAVGKSTSAAMDVGAAAIDMHILHSQVRCDFIVQRLHALPPLNVKLASQGQMIRPERQNAEPSNAAIHALL
jgi:hypothetical protein